MKFLLFLFFALAFTNPASAQLKEGLFLFEQRKLSEASIVLEAIKENSPDYYHARGYLGGIAFLENKYLKAEKILEEVLKKVKNNPDFYYWYGASVGKRMVHENMFVKAREASKVKTALEKAIRLNEKHLGAQWGLMEYYLHAPVIAGGGKEKALKIAREIEKIDKKQGALAMQRIQENYSIE